jgi:hypothetical protein
LACCFQKKKIPQSLRNTKFSFVKQNISLKNGFPLSKKGKGDVPAQQRWVTLVSGFQQCLKS